LSLAVTTKNCGVPPSSDRTTMPPASATSDTPHLPARRRTHVSSMLFSALTVALFTALGPGGPRRGVCRSGIRPPPCVSRHQCNRARERKETLDQIKNLQA
jgi:hypothetical protein